MVSLRNAPVPASARDAAGAVMAPVHRAAARHRVRRRFTRHKLGLLGLGCLSLLLVMAIFAPLVAGQSPETVNLRLGNQPPSRAHILGTDAVGRDVWARLVYGARVSLSVGAVAVGISTTIAVLLGSLAGYFGGRVDSLVMRFTDVVMCFPTFLLIITATAVLRPSILNVMVIIGIFGWTGMCRLMRGQFLSLRRQDFVLAAHATGAPPGRILFGHVLPNAVGPVIVAATFAIGSAILTEAGLGFLGLGVQEPTPSWGTMLLTATQLPVLEGMPWRWLPPAIAVSLTVLSVNFVGDALRDALDPRTHLET